MQNVVSYRELAENFLATRSEKDFNLLYKRVQPGLRNYIMNVVKDAEATEDILVNTLTKMWTKIDQYDPKYQITTWLYRIAFNESLGWIRERNRKYSIDNMEEFGVEISSNNKINQSVEELLKDYEEKSEKDYLEEENHLMEQYALALSCIKGLKPMYRDFIEDRLINNMKYEDIAEKYDVNLQTVKNRIRRGKMLIMEAMEKI
jgi:RNA polymerase sigma-70 factor (ECF subfamily)